LSDAEVRKLWSTLDAIGGPAAAVIKLCLLTGQRRGECAGLRRSEISGDTWTLPAARTKNKHEHSVPLTGPVLELIESMARLGDAVFTTGGDRPVANFSDLKIAVDVLMGPTPRWTWHDVRRTTATGLQRLGIRLEVTEAVLNHVGGSRAGIVGIYQRAEYRGEKRKALEAWADAIFEKVLQGEPLVAEEDDKVVRLRRA
jgi:integrase